MKFYGYLTLPLGHVILTLFFFMAFSSELPFVFAEQNTAQSA